MESTDIRLYPMRYLQILNLIPYRVVLDFMYQTLDTVRIEPGLSFVCLCNQAFQRILIPTTGYRGENGILCSLRWHVNNFLLQRVGYNSHFWEQGLIEEDRRNQRNFLAHYELIEHSPNHWIVREKHEDWPERIQWPSVVNSIYPLHNLILEIDLDETDPETQLMHIKSCT